MVISPAYQDALTWLHSFLDNARTHAKDLSLGNFDLLRMENLMTLLDAPHKAYASVHVAGTKGKGSVAAMCASILQEAGFRVGLYTSPHLEDFTERIQVDGEPIAQGKFAKLVDEIKPFVAKIPGITTFEIGTALAFWYFAKQEVDFAVLEVGLGGRVDATNIVTPMVSAITSISLDHVPVLGTTLEEIAAEKAGIIKDGISVVTAQQHPEVHKVVASTAFQRSAPIQIAGDDYRWQFVRHTLDEQVFWVWPKAEQAQMDDYIEGKRANKWTPLEFRIPLLGEHQLENATVAYTAMQALRAQGIVIREAAFRRGFANLRWAGRFEIVGKNPLIVLDAAHNADSIEKLARTLDTYTPDKPIHLLLGVSADKNLPKMLAQFPAQRIAHVHASRSTHPRAMSPNEIAEQAIHAGFSATPYPTIEDALPAALDALEDDAMLLVTGSVFIVGAAKNVLDKITNH